MAFTPVQKVLIATPLYPPDSGGPATYAHGLEEALRSMNIEVVTVSFGQFRKYPSCIRHFLYSIHVFKKMSNVNSVIILDTVSVAVPTVLQVSSDAKK